MSKTNEGKMSFDKLSNGDIEDLFTTAFEQQIASENGIESFEAICKRTSGNSIVEMEVTITGLAGSPTIEAYRNKKVKGCASVEIDGGNKGNMKFNLVPKSITSLNTNDFLVVYKSE